MDKRALSYAEFDEGYRIVVLPDGVTIEATDYHARPLRLTKQELAAMGLVIHPDKATKRYNGHQRPRIIPSSDF